MVRWLLLLILAALDTMSALHTLTGSHPWSHRHLVTKKPVVTHLRVAPNLILKRRTHLLSSVTITEREKPGVTRVICVAHVNHSRVKSHL